MKKIIIGFIISLFIVNSCRIGTEYVKWEADKSEIDYKAQTVTIRIKKELGMNPDFNQRFYVSKPFHIEAVTYDTKKEPGKAHGILTVLGLRLQYRQTL